jgi:16S rRNA C967 or C1407 C5-methylase (RsmB/RsmF family)/NOL1/NOP2/fmu family ribosome biogenesis protein
MFPEGFKNRIISQKYIDSEALLKALDEPSPVSIRVNPSKWNKKPVNAESVPWCKNGYYLSSRPSYTLDPLFHSGCYYPQEASGMFLEEAVRQSTETFENICVLDLCGAPGGKSVLLSDMLGSGSFLVANDVIRSRALILAETITKWGSGNTIVTQSDPAVFGRLSGYFDLIFADTPCSGEGMFRNPIAVSEWSEGNADHCAERQRRIIKDIWPALKENGILIYSTCTFNLCENEENIKWLVDNHEAEILRLNISQFPGIKEIDYQGVYGYGFYPGKVRGEGFFLSVIRKRGRQDIKPVRSHRISDLKPVKSDIEIAEKWSHFPKEKILKWGDEVFAVPCDPDNYLHLFQNLKVVKAGTKIFTVKNNDYLPSHELGLSAQIKNSAFPHEETGLAGAISYMRRDSFFLKNASKGWNIMTYKGVNLGFVNNIDNRVNNYFPVEWRIRMDASALTKSVAIDWQ